MSHQSAIAFAFDERAVRLYPTNSGSFVVVAKDVADALGYRWNGAQVIAHVPDEWKGVRSVLTPYGSQELLTLTEEGLYFFLARSDKPKARPFQKWLAGEVLPSIRKHGHYGRGPSISQQLTAHGVRSRLLKDLKRETDPALRQAIHAQLDHASRLLGLDTPPIEAIGHAASPDHESPLLEEFWEAVDNMLATGYDLNHSRSKDLLAINLPQVYRTAAEARLALPDSLSLRRLLRASRDPRFVAVKAVNSAIDDGAVKCWVFSKTTH